MTENLSTPDEPGTDAILANLHRIGVAADEAGQFSGITEFCSARDEIAEKLRAGGGNPGDLIVSALLRPLDEIEFLIYDSGQYNSQSEAEAAWETDYKDRTRSRIQARVNDWLQRLNDLRQQMATWIGESPEFASMAIVDLPPAAMFEELMERAGVPQAKMPVFEFKQEGKRVLRFQPKALWVIGANGRVDLITKNDSLMLVDRSDHREKKPNWMIFYTKRQSQAKEFNRDTFFDVLRLGAR